MLEALAKTSKLKMMVGNRIALEREKRGWKQPDLAAAADISLDGLRQYEQKKRWPRPEEWERISQALGIDPGRLLEESKSMPDESLKELLGVLSALDNTKTQQVLAYAKSLASGTAATSPGPPPIPNSNQSGKKPKDVSS